MSMTTLGATLRSRRAAFGVPERDQGCLPAEAVAPIASLIERIRAHCEPVQIWLFGSRARGDARDDSDWDLLVAVEDGAANEMFDPLWMWRVLGLGRHRADIVVLPASEFIEDIDTPNTIAFSVAHEGRLIYER